MGGGSQIASYDVLLTGITVLTAVFVLACANLVGSSRTIGRTTKHTLITCLVLTLAGVVLQWLEWRAAGIPSLRMSHMIAIAAEFTIAPAIPVIAAQAIRRSRLAPITGVALIANLVLQVASLAVPLVFIVNDQGYYERGPLYFAYVGVYVFGVAYMLVQGAIAARRRQGTSYVAVLSILLCLAAGIIPQLLFADAQLGWTAIALCLTLYYIYYNDLIQKTDELTGLLNRRSYERHLADLKGPAQIYLLDLNDFKSVNDLLGHTVGDEVLVKSAALIRRSFGRQGLCYRTGGDEFVVIIDGVHARSPREPQSRVDYFLEAVESARQKNENLCGISVGYGVVDKDGDPAKALEQADKMMYEAKRASGSERGARARGENASVPLQ